MLESSRMYAQDVGINFEVNYFVENFWENYLTLNSNSLIRENFDFFQIAHKSF